MDEHRRGRAIGLRGAFRVRPAKRGRHRTDAVGFNRDFLTAGTRAGEPAFIHQPGMVPRRPDSVGGRADIHQSVA